MPLATAARRFGVLEPSHVEEHADPQKATGCRVNLLHLHGPGEPVSVPYMVTANYMGGKMKRLIVGV